MKSREPVNCQYCLAKAHFRIDYSIGEHQHLTERMYLCGTHLLKRLISGAKVWRI